MISPTAPPIFTCPCFSHPFKVPPPTFSANIYVTKKKTTQSLTLSSPLAPNPLLFPPHMSQITNQMPTKKTTFTSLFKHREPRKPWPWPSCKHPRTESFRVTELNDTYKTVNSVYLDVVDAITTPPDSWFTNSSESASFSTTVSDESGAELTESIIRGLRSERFFFEPGDTKSILEEAKAANGVPFKESVALAMESEDPYVDFRVSMEEMVEAHGLKDWECLEELFLWYLRVNGKNTHGFIVGAFVDLLVGILSTTPPPLPSAASSLFEECKEVDESFLES